MIINKFLYKLWGYLLIICPILVYIGLEIFAYLGLFNVIGPDVTPSQALLLGLLYIGPFIILGLIMGNLYLKFGNGKLATSTFSTWSVILGIITFIGTLLGYLLIYILFFLLNWNSEGGLGLIVVPGLVLWGTGIVSVVFLIIATVKAYKIKKTTSFNNLL